MASLGEMIVKILGDASDFRKTIDDSQKRFVDFGKSAERIGKDLTKWVTLPLVGIGVAAVKSAADLEMQTAAFETMLGSARDAERMLRDLTDLAAKTPFQLTDLADGTKTLLAFGIAADDVLPTLQMLGDISLGDSQRLGQLALVFGQVQSAGRLMGQDLLQLINVGFNPLQTISAKTGETMAELKDRMAAGGISAEEVAEAFRSATSEGGLFFGGMERASQTLTGQISTLKDNVAILGRSFAQILMPTLKELTTNAIALVQRFADMDEKTRRNILTVAGLVAAIGPLVFLVGKTITVISSLRAAFITLNLTMAANPVLALVAGLTALIAITVGVVHATGLLASANQKYQKQLNETVEALKELSLEEQKRARAAMLQELIEKQEALRIATEKAAEAEVELEAARERNLAAVRRRDTSAALALGRADEAYQQQMRTVRELTAQSGMLEKAIEQVDAQIAELQALEDREQQMRDLEEESRKLREEAEKLNAEMQAQTLTTEQLLAQQEEWEKKLREIADAQQAVLDIEQERRAARLTEEQELQAVLQAEAAKREAAEEAYQARLEREREVAAELVRVAQEQANAQVDIMRDRDTTFIASAYDLERFEQEAADRRLAAEADRLAQMKALNDQYNQQLRDMARDLTRAIGSYYSALYDRQVALIEANVEDEEEREAQIRAVRRKEALMQRRLSAFNITLSTAEAIMKFLANPGGTAGVVLSIAAGVAGALQLGAVLAAPLPALAQGGIVTGPTQALVGEGGQPEVVFPLDRLGDFMAQRAEFSNVGGGGDIHLVVQMDSQPILDKVFPATRDGRILIDARAVV